MELLLIAWLILCVANVLQALRAQRLHYSYVPPIRVHHWLVWPMAAVAGGMWGLARQHRWRAVIACGVVMLATGVASGALQITSCPHAAYLQVAGLYVPVFGDPCGNNPQNDYLRPWWMD